VGLAIVKWPILVQNVSALPVFEGVVACQLTAMSLLAFLGLRYPVRMLPILLFEVIWKVTGMPGLDEWHPGSNGPGRRRAAVAPWCTEHGSGHAR
jgi:hypothetical protein